MNNIDNKKITVMESLQIDTVFSELRNYNNINDNIEN